MPSKRSQSRRYPRIKRVQKVKPFSLITTILLLGILVTSIWAITTGNFDIRNFASGVTYYVDCNTGNDSNDGKDPSRAWRSISKANRASLAAGDKLLLKRGCVWTKTNTDTNRNLGSHLEAKWNGTSSSPVTIGAYGSGDLPILRLNVDRRAHNNFGVNLQITGSYQIIENIKTEVINHWLDSNCANQPTGFYVGFNFINNSSYNQLRHSIATMHSSGVHIKTTSHHNRVVYNTITDNIVMQTNTSSPSYDDAGGFGLALRGSDNEVAHNTFSGNKSICSYDFGSDGSAIEVFEGIRNTIHHNTSVNDRNFTEMGSSSSIKSDSNTYAYNSYYSDHVDSRFFITRGANDTNFGPVTNTKLFNNVAWLTGSESSGIVCGSGCNTSILTARNNIVKAELKALFADGQFNESHNIYWDTVWELNKTIQLLNGAILDSTSSYTNPLLIDPANRNFQLQATSPALDKGIQVGWQRDLKGTQVPRGATTDIGGYEY